MKKFNSLTKSMLLAVSLGILSIAVQAQTARIQLIHNAADPDLDTVDIYLNGARIDDVMFRKGTGIVSLPSGVLNINVNQYNSTDSGNNVLARFSQTLAANSSTVMMISGLLTPANFAPNPNSLNTALKLTSKTLPTVSAWTASAGKTHVNFFHGVTDAPSVDLVSNPVPSSGTLPAAFKFGDVNGGTTAIFMNSVSSYLEVKIAGSVTNLTAFMMDNTALPSGKFMTFFASGFALPAANMNGAAMGLFAIDTNGTVMPVPGAARVQLINNSPDTLASSIQMLMNANPAIDNVLFRGASPYVTVPSGVFNIYIRSKASNDTLYSALGQNVVSGKIYNLMAIGVKDTTLFAGNPDGLDRRFQIVGIDTLVYEASTNTNAFQYYFINGVSDHGSIDLNRITSPASTLINDGVYAGIPVSFSSTSNFVFNISNSNQTAFWGSYFMAATGLKGKSGIVFTSGLAKSAGNPAYAAPVKVLVALADGSVQEVKLLAGKIQVINNSPDPTNTAVDIYLNGTRVANDLGFRKATPLMDIAAFVPVRAHVCLASSTDTSSSLWSASLLPDSSFTVTLVRGLLTPSDTNYVANPQAKDRSFNVRMFNPGKLKPDNTNNNELLFYHGSPDMGTVTIIGEQEPLWTARNNSYNDFYKYVPAKSNAGTTYIISDPSGATIATYKANFTGKINKVGTLFLSGFRKTIDTARFKYKVITGPAPKDTQWRDTMSFRSYNKGGSIVGLYIAWQDGTVDTLQADKGLGIGMAELADKNAAVLVYPNPASSKLNVVYESGRLKASRLSLYDIRGVEVQTMRIEDAGTGTIAVDLEGIKPGLYVVKLECDTAVLTTKIVVE